MTHWNCTLCGSCAHISTPAVGRGCASGKNVFDRIFINNLLQHLVTSKGVYFRFFFVCVFFFNNYFVVFYNRRVFFFFFLFAAGRLIVYIINSVSLYALFFIRKSTFSRRCKFRFRFDGFLKSSLNNDFLSILMFLQHPQWILFLYLPKKVVFYQPL